MRICDIYIDGFGIYRDQKIINIPDGVILFIGKNEGGKTTLMEFIRTVLFGFPVPKVRNNYPPLRGGKHGGSIRLLTKTGQAIGIQRFGKIPTLYYEDGRSENIEPSGKLFNIDRRTFEKIFAVGLGDLQGLGILSEDGVKGRIFSASAGIGAKSIPNIMNNIKTTLESLLKSGRAINPEINRIVKESNEIDVKIRELQQDSKNYGELQKRLAELNEQIEENQREVSSMRKRVNKIELIEQARKIWVELIESKDKLDELEFASNFPTKGLERFESLKETINNDRLNLNEMKRKVEQMQTNLQNIKVDEKVINNRTSIELLLKEREKLMSAIEDFPVVERQRKDQEDKFIKELKNLGTNWDKKRLSEVDTSIQTQNKAKNFEHKIESALRMNEQAKINLQNRQNNEKNAKIILDEAQKALESFEKPDITEKAEIRKQKDVIQKIRSLFYQKDNLNTQLNAKRDSFNREHEHLNSLTTRESQLFYIPLWTWIATVLIGFILIVLSVIMKSYLFAVIMLLVVIVCLFGLYAVKKHQTKSKNRIDEEIQRQNDIINRISEDIKSMEVGIKRISDEINEQAKSIGLTELNYVGGIDEIERKLDQMEEKIHELDRLEADKKNAERNYQIAVKDTEEARRSLESTEKELESLIDEWRQWITSKGFEPNTSPSEFGVILKAIENAQETENSLQDLSARIEKINDYIAEKRRDISNVLEACGIPGKSSEVGISEIDILEGALKTALENQKKNDDLKEKIKDSIGEINKLNAKIANLKKEIDDLMEKAKAKDEDEFRYIAESHNKWLDYRTKYETNKRNLISLIGNEEAVKSIETELMETDSFSLLLEKNKLEQKINEIDEEIRRDIDERGRLKEKIDQILQEEELSKLLFDQKALREQLSSSVKKWATLVILQSLIKQTREKYERERQPKVIQEASEYIKIITDKNYRLMMPTGENNVEIENTDTMERKDEICWSGGLADQVYLAVRFGLAKDFSEHSEPLPIILDDIFVRFDDGRQLGTAKVILDVAKNHQIFIFSCHPLTREIMENAYIETGSTVSLTHYIIDDGAIIKV